ncbi:MAG: hypothetical protein IJ735_02600 [Clostridia bacterium]|nr:hypothetical protein [Clostridia bacterium]
MNEKRKNCMCDDPVGRPPYRPLDPWDTTPCPCEEERTYYCRCECDCHPQKFPFPIEQKPAPSDPTKGKNRLPAVILLAFWLTRDC